jgi:uncharacterized repeat protein (TIGR01451 family)
MCGILAVAALFATLVFPAKVWAVNEDITPPKLDALSINPTSVDVTSGSKTVTVTATITDPAAAGGVSSGVAGGSIGYSSPSAGQNAGGTFQRTSGDQFQATVTIPQFAQSGTWKPSVSVFDNTGNRRGLSFIDLQAAGINADLTVTSTSDISPPQISALTVSPGSVTVTPPNGTQTVTATATITDNLSGVSTSFNNYVTFQSPTSKHFASGYFQHTTGDQYQATISVQPYVEHGTWHVYSVQLADKAGNSKYLFRTELQALGIDPTFDVASPTEDFTPPTLTSLSVEPACTEPGVLGACVDATSQDQVVTVKATITDDLAGVSYASFSYSSPSGIQSAYGYLQRTTGDNFQGTVTIHKFAEAGHWQPSFSMADRPGNSAYFDAAQLRAKGFDISIGVSKTDTGVVDPGGPPLTTGTSASPTNPIQTGLTVPAGGTGGNATLVITPRTTPAPPDFYFLDQQLDITAPAQPDAGHAMKIEFLIDSSVFTANPQVQLPPGCIPPAPGAPPPSCSITVFKDGTPVAKCTAVPPSAISPDPCVVDPQEKVGDDTKITIYSTTASKWNFGVNLTQGGADLSVTKTDSPDPVSVGSSLTYTLTAGNAGPDTATGVTVTDTLPAGVTFASAAPSQGDPCTETGGTVTCNLGSLAKDATATVEIKVTPQTAGPITNSVSVSGDQSDPDQANNTDEEQTTVQAAESSFSLRLSPASATNQVGTTHTVKATLTENGSGVSGETIIFTVSGANSDSASRTTSKKGKAVFSYTGSRPGSDTITACHDANGNRACDAGEATATATKIWTEEHACIPKHGGEGGDNGKRHHGKPNKNDRCEHGQGHHGGDDHGGDKDHHEWRRQPGRRH